VTIDTTGTRSGTIDSTRWPDVARVPGGPVAALSAKVATSLLHDDFSAATVLKKTFATQAAACSRTSFFVPRPPKKPAPSHADSG
jgi:hypothetical protein